MSINARQFHYLHHMGIPVWQQHHVKTNVEAVNNTPTFSLASLQKQAFFCDVLLALNLSIGEISIENNTLNMGMFNWQFTDKQEISYHENMLQTPELRTLVASATLKKQLWQTLFTHMM